MQDRNKKQKHPRGPGVLTFLQTSQDFWTDFKGPNFPSRLIQKIKKLLIKQYGVGDADPSKFGPSQESRKNENRSTGTCVTNGTVPIDSCEYKIQYIIYRYRRYVPTYRMLK